MTKTRIILALKLFRIPSVIAMSLFIFIPLAISTGHILFSIIQTLPFLLMVSGEIALNDCCDIEKDKINKPQRPLTSGILTKKAALILTFIVISISLAVGVYIYHTNTIRLFLFLVVAVILSSYNLKTSIIPLLKTFMTAVATVLSIALICTYIHTTIEFPYLLAAAFMFILGREFMMDIRDIPGDTKENYRTLAVIFGQRKLKICSVILIAISDFLYLFFLLSELNTIRLIMFILVILIESFLCYRFIISQTAKQQNLYILLFWIPMILMLLIII